MKVIGFYQLRNELSKGNLENWMKCMQICDYIYVHDHASSDGSLEYYKNFSNVNVTTSNSNELVNEMGIKKGLLEKLLGDHPDVDWIFWMDGDTLLDGRLLKDDAAEFNLLLEKANLNDADCISLGHLNLWRSDVHYRLDSLYHGLHTHGVKALWKNTGDLHFVDKSGLHQRQYPLGIKKEWRGEVGGYEPCLIHRGFATDNQIIGKYNFYKSMGQSGWDLDRLLCEKLLQVKKVDSSLLPQWFKIKDDKNPSTKTKIKEIYAQNHNENLMY